jgi:hypothetical protein
MGAKKMTSVVVKKKTKQEFGWMNKRYAENTM